MLLTDEVQTPSECPHRESFRLTFLRIDYDAPQKIIIIVIYYTIPVRAIATTSLPSIMTGIVYVKRKQINI